MKTSSNSQKKEQVEAASNRPVGSAAENLPKKQKKMLNLEEESKRSIGRDKLAVEQAARHAGDNS